MIKIKKKIITTVLILLFIGLAFTPSINANVGKEELVEFTTEFCGLNGGKQTVKLTQQEADEVEALFDSIREQLNTTGSRVEAEEIFKDAVVELGKYGLLGGLSIKQAQRLVTGGLGRSKLIQLVENLNNKKQVLNLLNWNILCLVAGKTTNTWVIPLMGMISNRILISTFDLIILIHNLWPNFLSEEDAEELLYSLFVLIGYLNIGFLALSMLAIPIIFGNGLALGYYHVDFWGFEHEEYANGWIFTLGVGGPRLWLDKMYGHICPYVNLVALPYVGIIGFTGLRIHKEEDFLNPFYLGFSPYVKIGKNPPDF